MNQTFVEIASREVIEDEKYIQHLCGPSHIVKTEAFTLLPPSLPNMSGPLLTPNPYRVLPPIVSRKQPSFVIIQELGSRPLSQEPSASGRVSPFRGCGFKPSPTSRQHSPSRQNNVSPQGKTTDNDKSRDSQLPVAPKKTPIHKVNKSAIPAQPDSSIPVQLNQQIPSSQQSQVIQKSPLKSTENLLNQGPSVSESDLKFALRVSNTKQIPPSSETPCKPRISVETRITAKSVIHKSSRAAAATNAKNSTTSPVRKNLHSGQTETVRKTAVGGGKDTLVKSSPAHPKMLLKSPSKIVSTKSKENLLPCSNPPTPIKVVKNPGKITKMLSKPPIKMPKKDIAKPTTLKKVDKTATAKLKDDGVHGIVSATTATVGSEPSIASLPIEDNNSTTSTTKSTAYARTDAVEKNSKPLKAMMKRVGRKALTTNNLMAALRKSASEAKNNTEVSTRTGQRKELPHMDTSKSLPISTAATNLPESSVTLIQTATEPAPIKPELISEIGLALVDAKAAEEGIHKEVSDISTVVANEAAANASIGTISSPSKVETTANVATINSPPEMKDTAAPNTSAISNTLDVKKCKIEVVGEAIGRVESMKLTPQKEAQSEGLPHPVHAVAVAKIEEAKQEITSTIMEIMQKPDSEVRSDNVSNRSENWNGISKSSWLNKRSQSRIMKKLSIRKLKETPSTESLMSNITKASRWHRFKSKCPKCFGRASDTHSVNISTITETAVDAANVIADPKRVSFMRKSLMCVCCQCQKSSKAKKSPTGQPKRSCGPKCRCFRLKYGFANVFDKVAFCKRNKKVPSKSSAPSPVQDTEVACVGPLSEDSKPGLCQHCCGNVFKCFGILCCVNSALCMMMRRKCVCCGERKKKVISEVERRSSAISVQQKRKWTHYFTDFSKLDASFVEHVSTMKAAIPVLPVRLAWICLILNVFLPGFGTLSSGIFCLFVGKPRFSINDSISARIGSFIINLFVASSQLFTVLFCLVGWGWSIWWGITMMKMAKKNQRIILAEQESGAIDLSPVATRIRDPEKGTESNR